MEIETSYSAIKRKILNIDWIHPLCKFHVALTSCLECFALGAGGDLIFNRSHLSWISRIVIVKIEELLVPNLVGLPSWWRAGWETSNILATPKAMPLFPISIMLVLGHRCVSLER